MRAREQSLGVGRRSRCGHDLLAPLEPPTQTMFTGSVRVWAVLVAMISLSGCGLSVPSGPADVPAVASPEDPGTPHVEPRATPVSAAARDMAFPSDTLQDWVSYGDRAAVIEIVDQTQPAASNIRTVGWKRRSELWANPARPRETTPATGTTVGGSFVPGAPNSQLQPSGGDPALFVGHTYVAVLTHTAIGGAGSREWIPLVILPFDDGLVGDGEQYRGWDGQQATLDAVWGLTGPEVSRILRSTPIDSAVTRFASRDAYEKYQLSFQDR